MNFLPTYYTMCYHDSPDKSHRDAFKEGIAKAAAMENEEDGFNLPCKDRCYEAGIIAYLLRPRNTQKTRKGKDKNDAVG